MSTTMPNLILGSPGWLAGAGLFLALAALLILWSYGRTEARPGVRILGALLKAAGFTALALILVEPLLTGSRPKAGANAFAVLADNSQSLQVRGEGQASRGEWLRDRLKAESTWATRLSQDFDVRRYAFDTHLRSAEDFDSLPFDGNGTALTTSLDSLSRRFRGLPLAGALLFTDGNRTDVGEVEAASLPPIYPVIPPSRGALRDVGVTDVSVSQANFEAAPVVIRADVAAKGVAGEQVIATVTDEAGEEIARQEQTAEGDERPLSFRFQFRPDRKGLSFYKVNAFVASDPIPSPDAELEPSPTREQTFANNGRLLVVDQGGGPYRVLYVGGRPNWEFKFIRRALADDEQVELVGMLRIALRQPKFDFRDPRDRSTSEFYKGFDNPDAETAERVDQAVIARFGTRDETELRDGFPKAADELYAYHAVILDDIEAAYFTPDQLALLRNFVSVRGGGLLMLGGPNSFADGRYDRTPVGDLLPVYLNRSMAPPPSLLLEREYRFLLTRDGWLQPWARTRKTEDEERKRIATMPPFRSLSLASGIKPGAEVLAEVRSDDGETAPALVAQRFGKGHAAALLIGDLWRWAIRRESAEETDIDRAWRQTVRWLVGDVTGRVDVAVAPKSGSGAPAVEIVVRARDPEYRPLDNARVTLNLSLPGGESLTLDASPDGREAGAYSASYVARNPGAYKVVAAVTAPDGSAVGEREAGWAAQPAADEFARLEPDRLFLEELAAKTGGEVVDGDALDSFVASLSARAAPITEPWTMPLWHQPLYFLIALACLTAEWGLRRVNGLA